MWQINSDYSASDYYSTLEKELLALIQGEKNLVANLSNISSWIYHSMPQLNWCGFYLWSEEDQELILGPFQGLPACLRIKSGKGVCGQSYSQGTSIRVNDVNSFSGHITCDSRSMSELVIPLRKKSKIYGVLDLDSPKINRFSEKDERELNRIADHLVSLIF